MDRSYKDEHGLTRIPFGQHCTPNFIYDQDWGWAIEMDNHIEAIAMDNSLEDECWKCNGTDKLSENYGIHLKDSDVYHIYNMHCRLG